MTSNRTRGRPPHPDILTPAEWQVVEAVRHGATNSEIAARQAVSRDAVKYHVANALQKLGLNSRLELRHWNGIRRDSRIYAREMGMGRDIKLGPVGQIARSVKDIEAAKSWYIDMLRLERLYSFGNIAFFNCGGMRLVLSEGDGAADSIFYFRVPDIQAAHVALAERGVEFINAPHMIHRHEDGTEEWMAFFKDNEGRPLAIMAQA